MKLSLAYLQQREDWFQEGFQKGLQEARQQGFKKEMIENVFKVRFGVINPDLASLMPQLLQLPNEELTRILVNASESELLHYFDHN